MLQKLGLEKLTIPLPFRLDHVHCFLAEGEHGYTIIDAGLHDSQAKNVWESVLIDKKIEKIILTHLHPDHTGYAGVLQQRTNAPILMSELDAKATQTIWQDASITKLSNDYASFAVPEAITKEIGRLTKQSQSFVRPLPNITHFLQEKEQIEIGKFAYDVIHTPGHSEGLVCFYQKDNRVLLSTDHILPKITPNIAYWFYGEQNPLQSYQNSLEKIKQLEIDYVIPSHGEPFDNVYERIEEIWAHHEERLEVTYNAMKDGVTVFEMCQTMFPYELSVYDYQFAIGETVAHMEYLWNDNKCVRDWRNGHWIYKAL